MNILWPIVHGWAGPVYIGIPACLRLIFYFTLGCVGYVHYKQFTMEDLAH